MAELKYIKVIYFSDDCAAQYKNSKKLMNFCHHYTDCTLEADWIFFSTSRGKSAVDQLGVTIKQLTPSN